MATITPSAPGAAVTYQAANGGGDKFANTGRERLHVRNGGVGSITAHVTKQATCNFGVVHSTDTGDDYTIGAGSDKILPALDPARYNDGSGFVNITYTGVTSVTVGVIA